MSDLLKVLENRLAALKGEPQKWEVRDQHGKLIEFNDTSKEYIIRAWTEAGILNEEGDFVDMTPSCYRTEPAAEMVKS